jgi:hypothetical protein
VVAGECEETWTDKMQCSEVSIRFVEGGCNVIEFLAEYRNQFVGRGEIVDLFAANTAVRKALNEGINCRKDTRLGGLF